MVGRMERRVVCIKGDIEKLLASLDLRRKCKSPAHEDARIEEVVVGGKMGGVAQDQVGYLAGNMA
ncbi:hypothetical protein LMTR13_08465 [Bradyrhizobium icense]|uniref:Uncharacterized protein n=1 Tax=Bradyrhizobium icense TaxID=1274631 RepID=A0A1B1UBQ5_9BRAD|nr:hypothetical protein LMTR13_08465 [Bradyrhizobium icense]